MKTKIVLGIAFFLTVIVIWNRAAKSFAPSAPPPPVGHLLISQNAKEIVPGSRLRWDLIARSRTAKDSPVETAHGTPQMNSEAVGPYSYQGSANEFKAICGFEIPDWVEPVEGEYYITKHGNQFVSQASLKYKTDPAQIEDFTSMVLASYAGRWPDKPPLVFYPTQSDPAGPKYWNTSYHIIGKNFDSSTISIGGDSDGNISISNTRGPEGWDR